VTNRWSKEVTTGLLGCRCGDARAERDHHVIEAEPHLPAVGKPIGTGQPHQRDAVSAVGPAGYLVGTTSSPSMRGTRHHPTLPPHRVLLEGERVESHTTEPRKGRVVVINGDCSRRLVFRDSVVFTWRCCRRVS
jgi:hypothetical protein